VEAVLVRLLSFHAADGVRTGALVGDDRVLDLGGAPLETFLDGDGAVTARAAVADADVTALPRLADVSLVAPVRPSKIVCLGYNYRGHVPNGASDSAPDPEFPDVFVKTPNTLGGPDEPVRLPAAGVDVDYEGEIAIVIGRRAHDVSPDEAASYIGGYTLMNDVSDRHWQGRSSQWELGKCFDGFAPLGPVVVTPDEVPDPHDLQLEVVREGVVTVSQSTSTLIFRMPFLVSYLSSVMTLEPGDIISTGSPQKLPEAREAHRPLASGDEVTIRVAGIGELTTAFVGGSA
jgi:2-keto-4-pentenoate hydratase/2-oxohepta-3-ene-1,7-dioic acid hydratase in catechol pathway